MSENGVSVIGVGECGTRIALDLAGEFDLGFVGDLIGAAGVQPPKVKFKFGFSRDKKQTIPADAIPQFFFGDFNRSNKIYLEAKKRTEIAQAVRDNPELKSEQILARLQANPSLRDLSFGKEDLGLIEGLRRTAESPPEFELLDFYRRDGKILLTAHGAGGYQYLSEAVTDTQPEIQEKVAKRPTRILFGLFGMGGGSGAGSTYSILTKDRLRSTRLSVAIGVMPNDRENDFFRKSGRFLTRYLGNTSEKRFDKLFLFSNRAAHFAAEADRQLFQQAESVEQQVLNRYISKFVYSMSALNSKAMTLLAGKAFDTMDCKRHLPDLAAVGIASTKSSDVPFEQLFLRAIAPMSVKDSQLSGMSTTIGATVEQCLEIRSTLESLIGQEPGRRRTSAELAEIVARLNRLTGFYRLIKGVHLFYLCRNQSAATQMEAFRSRANTLLSAITGEKISFFPSVLTYSALPEDIVLIVFRSGPTLDVFEAFVRYVHEAFFPRSEQQAQELTDSVRKWMLRIRDCTTVEESERLVSDQATPDFIRILSGGSAREEHELTRILEHRDEREREFFDSCDFAPQEIRGEQSEYFLTAANVLRACQALTRTMIRTKEVEANPPSEAPIM